MDYWCTCMCVCVLLVLKVAIKMGRHMPTKKNSTLTNVVVIGKRICTLAGTHPSLTPPTSCSVCEQQHVVCAAGLCYHPGSKTGSEVPSSSPVPSTGEQPHEGTTPSCCGWHPFSSPPPPPHCPVEEVWSWYSLIMVCVATVTVLSLVTVVLFLVCIWPILCSLVYIVLLTPPQKKKVVMGVVKRQKNFRHCKVATTEVSVYPTKGTYSN